MRLEFTKKELEILMKTRSKFRSEVASQMKGKPVSRQACEYHLKQFFKKPNKSVISRRDKKLFYRSKEDELRTQAFDNFHKEVNEVRKLRDEIFDRILIMSDTHAPYQHPDLLDYYADLNELVNPDLVINIGDELDNHAMSFHDSDPDLDSAGIELKKGREVLKQLASIFPVVYSVDSNHGSMAYRRQKAHGLPKHLILSYKDVVFSERDNEGNLILSEVGKDWKWANTIIAGTPRGLVKFKHGEGTADVRMDIAKERMSIVRGHHHSQFNIVYSASNIDLIFGMTVGCGIDDKSLAFNYNKKTNERPVIGCGLIMNGVPKLIPMPMDNDGRYTGKESLERIVYG